MDGCRQGDWVCELVGGWVGGRVWVDGVWKVKGMAEKAWEEVW